MKIITINKINRITDKLTVRRTKRDIERILILIYRTIINSNSSINVQTLKSFKKETAEKIEAQNLI